MATTPWPNDELTQLANRYLSDKGTTYSCAHGYTRVYGSLLAPLRASPLRLLEIGLVHGRLQVELPQAIPELGCPSLRMWADYLPQAEIHGLDVVDFTGLAASDRVKIWQADQGNRQHLESLISQTPAGFDLIIDDGSHASHHQQISLAVLFRHLAPGGIYVIEDLHFQPAGLELPDITPTRDFLYGLAAARRGMRLAIDQAEFGYLAENIQSLQFFDSISPRWPLSITADAMVVIRKKGTHPAIPGSL